MHKASMNSYFAPETMKVPHKDCSLDIGSEGLLLELGPR